MEVRLRFFQRFLPILMTVLVHSKSLLQGLNFQWRLLTNYVIFQNDSHHRLDQV